MSVHDLGDMDARIAKLKEMATFKGGGGSPPGGSGLDGRVAALEKSSQDMRDRLVRIEEKVASIERHGATKHDLSSLEATLIKWFVGTAFAMVGLASAISFGLARLIS